MKKALVLIASGTEEIEVTSIVNILRRAEVSVTLAGVDGVQLRGSRKITICADIDLDEISDTAVADFDALILPGGWEGTLIFCDNYNVQTLIKGFDNTKKIIGAICAAPLALDRANILSSHRFTCYPGLQSKISASQYENSKIVVSGNIYTSQGPATAMDFALVLASALTDKATFKRVSTELLIMST